MRKVLSSELYYTGGGIWCAWGQFEDGTVFLSNNDWSFGVERFKGEILDAVKRIGSDIYNVDIDTCEKYHIEDLNKKNSVDVWVQIFEQNPDCIDLDILKHQLWLA